MAHSEKQYSIRSDHAAAVMEDTKIRIDIEYLLMAKPRLHEGLVFGEVARDGALHLLLLPRHFVLLVLRLQLLHLRLEIRHKGVERLHAT